MNRLSQLLDTTRLGQSNVHVLTHKPLLILRVLGKYAAKLLFKRDSLRGVSFASSYACNFRCTHCYAKRFRQTSAKPLRFHEKVAVIDECLQAGAVAFDFVGGEIGIHPEFDRLVKFCRTYKTHVALASNGYEMTREKVRALKKAGVDKISVSIDAGTAEEHDAFRRKSGSFKRCFEAIDSIRAEGLTPVIITCVPRGATRNKEFHHLVKYAIDNRIQLDFAAAIPFGEWEGNLDVLCDADDLACMAEYNKKHPFLVRDNYQNMGSFGCPAAKQVLYVSEYGDVMPCAFTHISFGNVRTESIREIRQRMLEVPQFARYPRRCLAGEDRDFIDKHLSAIFAAVPYPPQAEDAFPDDTGVNAPRTYHMDIEKVDRPCPMCGSRRRSVIAHGREHEFDDTTHDLFFVVRCRDCKLVYLNPRPADSTLDVIYAKSYYCHTETYAESEAPRSALAAVKNALADRFGFPRRIRQLYRLLPARGRRGIKVLDVGCGNGAALSAFREAAAGPIETVGLDFDAEALRLVAARGHAVINSRIENASLPAEQFDIVYSNNVIEHIPDPMGMMGKVAAALKPDGVFLCETPNFDSLDAAVFSRSGHWGGYHFPRHWTFFTAESLARMAERVGLEVKSVSYHAVPIFWIWTAHSYLYRGRGRKDLAEKYFPLLEDRSNLLRSFLNKVFFTVVDTLMRLTTGKTALMAVVLRKPDTPRPPARAGAPSARRRRAARR